MFDQLNKLIKTDNESQERFEKFKNSFRKTQEKTAKSELKRARRIAVILGSAVTISLLFLIFAFSQYTLYERSKQQVEYLQSQLAKCQDEHED